MLNRTGFSWRKAKNMLASGVCSKIAYADGELDDVYFIIAKGEIYSYATNPARRPPIKREPRLPYQMFTIYEG